jgi:hypothetical protein
MLEGHTGLDFIRTTLKLDDWNKNDDGQTDDDISIQDCFPSRKQLK